MISDYGTSKCDSTLTKLFLEFCMKAIFILV